jgi:hypothetical protein
MKEPRLPAGLTYGGEGPGGEYYSKDIDGLSSISLWTKGQESWTAEELRAIARHQDWVKQAACKHENKSTVFMGGSEYEVTCDDCGMSF